MKLSRRYFLKGVVASAVGVTTGSVLETCQSNAETIASPAGAGSTNPTWLGQAPVISDDQIANTMKADIVIVGGGNAGTMCAFAAAENGATVAVIESQAKDKISYYGLHDIASINSRFCLVHGLPKIKKSEFIAEYQRRTHNRTNPRLVKKFADHSGEMIDWLLNNAPQEVKDSTTIENLNSNMDYFKMGGEINKFKCWKGCIQTNYQKTAPVLIARAEKQGAAWYWGHAGVVLVTETTDVKEKKETVDRNGVAAIVDTSVPHTTVTGVIAKNPEGKYVRFMAKKAVVLSGGDYGGNPEMYRALQDEQRWLYESHGLNTGELRCSGFGRDGSVIKMGLWAGGAMDPCPRALVSPQVMFRSNDYASNVLQWGAGFNGAMNPWGSPFVWLDSNGKRFTDETFMGIFGQLQRAERMKPGRYYAFFDKKWADLMSRSAPEHFSQPVGTSDTLDYKALFASWVERGPKGAEPARGGTVNAWGANTLDELLGYMGFDKEMKASVKAEIETYNKYCKNGEDEDFGRDPKMLLPVNEGPFFGMYSVSEKPMTGTVTLNGLVIDENQRVLDHYYNPIENLYASGNSSGGRFAVEYSTPIAGLTLGMAMTLGRILGHELTVKK
jgi:hypothetical protein